MLGRPVQMPGETLSPEEAGVVDPPISPEEQIVYDDRERQIDDAYRTSPEVDESLLADAKAVGIKGIPEGFIPAPTNYPHWAPGQLIGGIVMTTPDLIDLYLHR